MKNIFLLISLISFFSCAPTVIDNVKKTPKVSDPEVVKDEIEKPEEKKDLVVIKKPTKPENKEIDFKKIEKINH